MQLTQGIHLSAVFEVRRHLPLLVFLPGMDGSALSLRQQAKGLISVFDARCFRIPKDDTTDWSGLANRLIELVTEEQKHQPDRPIYLCGESFGACLALITISRRPNLFDRLVLINPASSFSRQLWSSLGATAVRWLPAPVYRFSSLGLLPFLTALERVSNRNRQALLQAMQQVTPETAAWRLSLLQTFQLNQGFLKQFQVPTLLIASGADRLLPSVSEVQRLAALLQNAQTITLSDSGHACLLETEVNLYHLLRQAHFIPGVRV